MSEIKESIYTADTITITDSMNTLYRDYAVYTAYNRAIPSVIDGLKHVQRKALWLALNNKKMQDGQEMKIAALTGFMLATAHYQHGDNASNDAITMMAQDFKFALPYFKDVGDVGTLRSPVAGAPRYVTIKTSPISNYLLKDMNLTVQNVVEGDKVEPNAYFPIIPTILFNATGGVAVGFAFSSVSKNPLQVIDAVKQYITTGELETVDLQPYVNNVGGRWLIYKDRYEHHGVIEVKNSTTVEITELPCAATYDSFEKLLNQLVEQEYMKDWSDESVEDNIKYVLKFERAQLADHIKRDTLYHRLKMYCKIPADNLTVIDFDGKIKRYWDVAELIRNFVDWRKTIYEQRKLNIIEELHAKIKNADERIKFITLVNDGTIVLKSIKSRKQAIEVIEQYDLSEHVLDIKAYNFTQDAIDKLLEKIKELNDELTLTEDTSIETTYLRELDECRDYLVKQGVKINQID